MDRDGRNNDYRSNAHILPSVVISSRKAHYRNDDLSSHTQQSLQANTAPSTTNNSSYLYPKAGKTRELTNRIQENHYHVIEMDEIIHLMLILYRLSV